MRSGQRVVRLKELRGGSNHWKQVAEKGFVLWMGIVYLLQKGREESLGKGRRLCKGMKVGMSISIQESLVEWSYSLRCRLLSFPR